MHRIIYIALLVLSICPQLSSGQGKYSSESKKLYGKAIKELKDNHIDAAMDLFKSCVASEPTYAEAYLNMSSIQFNDGDYAASLLNAKKAYENNKFQAPIYSQLGKCYYKTGNYDSASYYIEKSISMGSTGSNELLYLGKSQFKSGNYPDAIENFTSEISSNPSSSVAYNSRGMAYYEISEYDLAEADFRKALSLDENSAAIYSNLANACLANGKSEEAIGFINKGEQIGNSSEKVNFLILKGVDAHQKNELEEAQNAFEEAFKLDADNPIILINQAAVFLEQEQFESALDKCNAALEINEELMEAYLNRGIANEMLRNVQDACSDWEQAFILGSEIAEEYLNSATCNE